MPNQAKATFLSKEYDLKDGSVSSKFLEMRPFKIIHNYKMLPQTTDKSITMQTLHAALQITLDKLRRTVE